METKIDLTPLLCGEVVSIDFEIEFVIDEADAPEGVEFPEPVTARGRITNSGGYMRLCSEERVAYSSLCSRCLSPIQDTLIISFEKSVAVPGTVCDEDNDDYLFIENSSLDIRTPLCEQVILEFPSKLLCREDCRGLCPRCGVDLNKGDCACPKKELDPRLAVLAKFRDSLDD